MEEQRPPGSANAFCVRELLFAKAFAIESALSLISSPLYEYDPGAGCSRPLMAFYESLRLDQVFSL